jgi:hypothetical protein
MVAEVNTIILKFQQLHYSHSTDHLCPDHQDPIWHRIQTVLSIYFFTVNDFSSLPLCFTRTGVCRPTSNASVATIQNLLFSWPWLASFAEYLQDLELEFLGLFSPPISWIILLHEVTADISCFQFTNFPTAFNSSSRCLIPSSCSFTFLWYLYGMQYHGMLLSGALGLVLAQFKQKQ